MHINPFDLAGRSLVADEGKGNYAQAAAAAERLVATCEQSGSGLAQALLTRGVVEVLAGAPGAALDTFDRLLDHVPEPRLVRQAASFVWLASTQWGTSGIDAAGAVKFSEELQYVWHYSSAASDRRQRWSVASQLPYDMGSAGGVGEPSQWMDAELGRLDRPGLASLLSARGFWSALLLTASAGGARQREFLSSVDADVIDGSSAISLAEQELALDDHSGWGFVLRARAESEHLAGDTRTAQSLLHDAVARYREGGDRAGAASCLLLAGDWLLAPQSSPLLLGLLTNQPRGVDVAVWRPLPSATGLAEAEEAYRLATRDFTGCPRGGAAVALRRSYLAALRDAPERAALLAARAAAEFTRCGDERGFQIASMHAALHRLSAGIVVDLAETARDLTNWATSRGSPALAFHLGGLAEAWGRYLLHERGDVHAALRCHELAAHLHHGLGAVVAEAENHAAARDAYSYAGDEQRAALLAEKAVLALTPVLHTDHPLLGLALQSLPVMTMASLLPRYQSTLDADGLAAAVRRLRPLQNQVQVLLADVTSISVTEARELVAGTDLDLDEDIQRIQRLHLGTVKNFEPFLADSLDQAEWSVPWLRAHRLRVEGFWHQARQEFEAFLIQCRTSRSPFAREQEPHVLLALRRRGEAARAFEAVINEFGFPPFAGPLRWLERAGVVTAGARRFLVAEQRLVFLSSAHQFAQAAEAVRDLERSFGKQWWRHSAEPWGALERVASVAEGTGRLADAARLYEQAIDELESRRRGASRDSWQAGFYGTRTAAGLYAAASRCALRRRAALPPWRRAGARRLAEQALELAERGRARATADLLAVGPRDADDTLVSAWRAADVRSMVRHNQLHQLRSRGEPDAERLSAAEDAVIEADRELARVEANLARRSPMLLWPATGAGKPGLVERIVGSLPADTALVAYRLHEDSLLVWAVTRRGVAVAKERPLDRNAFIERIRLLREACAELADDWQDHAAHLGETLLDPIAAVLRGHHRLLIVPSGPLHGLPFSALVRHGEQLVASHTVSVLPTASLASAAPGGQRDHRPPVTAFGDPACMRWPDGNRAGPLRYARQEAEQVAARTGGTAKVGSAATKQAVLAALREPGVVHLASHGYFDSAAPLNSGVLVADGETLTAGDLMGMRIRAELVVLTACSTATGAVTHGEDVIGLPRALLVGGAGAVVAPLWEAYEGPTALFVDDLYRRLRTGQSAARALRDTQNDMRAGRFGPHTRHSGCWAPWITIENPGRPA